MKVPRKKITLPGIEIRREFPPYYPHEIPFNADYPAFNEKIRIPSNQDIKDGVTRPFDFFLSDYYTGYTGHNYYAEYERWKMLNRR